MIDDPARHNVQVSCNACLLNPMCQTARVDKICALWPFQSCFPLWYTDRQPQARGLAPRRCSLNGSLTSVAHLKLTDNLMQRYSRQRRCSDCLLLHSDCVTSVE